MKNGSRDGVLARAGPRTRSGAERLVTKRGDRQYWVLRRDGLAT